MKRAGGYAEEVWLKEGGIEYIREQKRPGNKEYCKEEHTSSSRAIPLPNPQERRAKLSQQYKRGALGSLKFHSGDSSVNKSDSNRVVQDKQV